MSGVTRTLLRCASFCQDRRAVRSGLVSASRALGFSTSIGIIHDGSGTLKPLGPTERAVFDDVSQQINRARQLAKNLYSGIRTFEENLAAGRPNDWRCRAGARYLYVCEDGLVHYCSQQRGYPAVPLERYTLDDIRRAFVTPKSCAPFCTIGCVHRVSTMDFWRRPQRVDRQEKLADSVRQAS